MAIGLKKGERHVQMVEPLMNGSHLHGVRIAGISCAVPTQCVPTDSFIERFGEEPVRKFATLSGIASRRFACKEQTASDLGFLAAQALLDRDPSLRKQIGALVFVSQTPDYRLPATACVLHKRLHLEETCLAFDVNLGCSAYVYGMQILGSLLETGQYPYGLLVVADTFTKCISPLDRTSAMLFGDAGSATLLRKDPLAVPIHAAFYTKGEGYSAILTPAGGYRQMDAERRRKQVEEGVCRSDFDVAMNGIEVFNFSIIDVPKALNDFLHVSCRSSGDFAQLVLHQANRYMVQQIAKRVKFPMDKVPISLDRYGNTGGASIPVTLVDQYGGCSGREIDLLLCGYGVGLSWGIMDVRVAVDDILPMIESDAFFDEQGRGTET